MSVIDWNAAVLAHVGGMMKTTIALSVILIAVSASAQEPVKRWQGTAASGVTAKHLTMPLTDEEYYTDRYSIQAWLSDGTRGYVSVLVTNLGPGSGKMTLKSRFTDTAGKNHRFEKTLKSGKYRISGKPFSVEAAGHRLWGVPKKFMVKAKSGSFDYTLTLTSGAKPWRPGTGRTTFGDAEHKYYDTTLVQPMARVQAVVNGKKIRGYGYVIHTHNNIAPYEMFKRMVQVRSLNGKTALWFQQFKTPSRYGNKRVGYLYLSTPKGVFATTRFRVKAANLQKDAKHANRYRVPLELTITATVGGKAVTVTVKAPRISKRDDVLKKRKFYEAAIIKQFAQPVNYTMDATVDVTVDGVNVIKGAKAAYEMNYLNK